MKVGYRIFSFDNWAEVSVCLLVLCGKRLLSVLTLGFFCMLYYMRDMYEDKRKYYVNE